MFQRSYVYQTRHKLATSTIAKVTIAVIVCVLLYVIIKAIIKAIDKRNRLKNANDEVINSDLSFTDAQYAQMATKLNAAMARWGTDEQAIYDVFTQLKTRSDLMKLISIFGIKKNKTLMEWIVDELTNSELLKVNNILIMKNINFTF